MEPLTQTTTLRIEDSSQVGAARRAASDLAKSVGFDEVRTSEAAVVAVELANNLLQHAGSGVLYLQFLESTRSVDIIAVDHGRGMVNVERCLEDGFSTRSTPGLGLGAISRLAVDFSAFSIPGRTTVVAARMAQEKTDPQFSVISTAIDGESLSGDSWAVSEEGDALLVVDGLGHGLLAAEAARVAVTLFTKYQNEQPQQIIERMHAGMRSTRGAAAAVIRIDAAKQAIHFAGIGNITCTLMNRQRSQSMVSHNGTLGHNMRRVQEFQYTYEPADIVLMQSDGLMTHSKAGLPSALFAQTPSIIAPFIFSEQVRGRDDATLLVKRLG